MKGISKGRRKRKQSKTYLLINLIEPKRIHANTNTAEFSVE
jgi:hypothetical protein